jgi:hypothetical protein
MKRFLLPFVLLALSVPLLMTLGVAGDESPKLSLEKECVFFGRILGSHVLLFPEKQVSEPVYDLPEMTQVRHFDVVNTTSGEWHPVMLSEDGHFCANVGMGKYELRGRGQMGKPYTIHSFNIPYGMAANLGDFWIETLDPAFVAREGWFSHLKESGWQMLQEGSGAIALRIEHITSDEAYEECEEWFAECHEDVFDQYASVIARR